MNNRLRIVENHYGDGTKNYDIQLNNGYDSYVLLTTRDTLEEARIVRDFITRRTVVRQEIVE